MTLLSLPSILQYLIYQSYTIHVWLLHCKCTQYNNSFWILPYTYMYCITFPSHLPTDTSPTPFPFYTDVWPTILNGHNGDDGNYRQKNPGQGCVQVKHEGQGTNHLECVPHQHRHVHLSGKMYPCKRYVRFLKVINFMANEQFNIIHVLMIFFVT